MSTAEQDSSLQVPLSATAQGTPTPGGLPAHSTAASNATGTALAGLWLDGDVLSCACPQCHGPMSIRLWLMVADCWMCGTSIELTEEQERVALALLEARKKEATKQTPTAAPTVAQPKAPAPLSVPIKPTEPASRPLQPQPKPVQAVAAPATRPAPQAVQPPGPATKLAVARQSAHDWLRDLPAWLVSLIFHIVAMLLLGLLTVPNDDLSGREILLTATMGTPGTEGGEKKEAEDVDAVVIEDPGPEQAPEPEPEPTKEEFIPPEPPPVLPPPPKPTPQILLPSVEERNSSELPRFESVRDALVAPAAKRMFEGRDPRVRTQMVLAEGGSMYTEAAVAQGLRWLARHQAEDGHWSLDSFHEHGDCDGRCRGQGFVHSDVAGTALALLPFLGAGQTHTRGMYQSTVRAGLEWLLVEQKKIGDLRGAGRGTMYAHGIATIALCEAYALTGDEMFRDPAQRAINWIVRAQHRSSGRNGGGWRYEPGQPGDTSVVGWQLMALRSGRMARLRVPPLVFQQASKFLDHVQHGDYGGLYSYQRGRQPDQTMTAEGLLCRQYLGWPASHRGLREGVDHLLENHLPSRYDPNIYYWYYGTQVMHHVGGEPWERWNNAMREALVDLQVREGHEAGSWTPDGGIHGGLDVNSGGRIYMTALAVCTLEVYYRHLPIYRSIEIESEE